MICYKTKLREEFKYHTRYMDTEDEIDFYGKLQEAHAYYQRHRRGRINEEYPYENSSEVMYKLLDFPKKNWGGSVVYRAVGYVFGYIKELKDPPEVSDTVKSVIKG